MICPHSGVRLAVASGSDVGLVRSINEDALLAEYPVFVVADGMGGHSAGEVAAATAISALRELVEIAKTRPLGVRDVEHALERARLLVAEVAEGKERGAGCTLSGVVLIEYEGVTRWLIVNIGDSRVYLHQGNAIAQLTHDHSLYNELSAAGYADSESIPRNMITRALGAPDARHDAWLLPVRSSTGLLICTDGLTGMVSDEEILSVLTASASPKQAAGRLIDAALAAGGRDNVSVIVVRVDSGVEESLEEVREEAHPDDEFDTTLDTTVDVGGAVR